MKQLKLIIAILITINTLSCSKGDPGPQGPAGPPGINGQNGTNGADGSIPKIYYFDIPLKKFIHQNYNSSWNTYAFIKNYTIQETDLVIAYVNLSSDGNGDNYWQQLPYTEYLDNSNFSIQHSFGIMNINDDSGNNLYKNKDIMFALRTPAGQPPYTNMNSDALLKYNIYIIKGMKGKKAKIPENINTNNINELKKYINNITNKKTQ